MRLLIPIVLLAVYVGVGIYRQAHVAPTHPQPAPRPHVVFPGSPFGGFNAAAWKLTS